MITKLSFLKSVLKHSKQNINPIDKSMTKTNNTSSMLTGSLRANFLVTVIHKTFAKSSKKLVSLILFLRMIYLRLVTIPPYALSGLSWIPFLGLAPTETNMLALILLMSVATFQCYLWTTAERRNLQTS